MGQRPLNSAYIARHGAAKRLTEPQPVVGHRRVTTGQPHAYLHGQTVDDSVPEKTYTREAPAHPGMQSKAMSERGTHKPGEATEKLQAAARLGRPPEKA